MRRLPALLAALLMPTAQPLLWRTAISAGALLAAQAPARAQSAEAAAKIAQTITVRIEGAAQGSGVLVKRDDNRYTVLTAWHVVEGQRPGEELDIYTPDGKRHKVEQGSIKRLGEVDMAVLSFSSLNSYESARIGDAKTVQPGDQVMVAGFPLNNGGKLIMTSGPVAMATYAEIDAGQGYHLAYGSATEAGMSGGPVLKLNGSIIGIHGRGVLDEHTSKLNKFSTKADMNLGISIQFYQYAEGVARGITTNAKPKEAYVTYIANAEFLLLKRGSENEVIILANKALSLAESDSAYSIRGQAKAYLGDIEGAILDYNSAIKINSRDRGLYNNRGLLFMQAGDYASAISDLSQSLAIDPSKGMTWFNRGIAKEKLNDLRSAIDDYTQ